MLDSLYGQVMRVRRRWAERHPGRRRTLARPVVSVGNLSVGGTGKTPVVAAIAQWLIANGERPSILSRGYARADAPEGVVVVSDGTNILTSIDRAGDEPLMLARQVPGAVVCVSPDRHLAGTLAERTLGCTIHVLDDGFQHVGLARNLDVLVTTVGEIPQGRVIPMGRLREPMDAASRAHVLVVSGATAGAAAAEAWALGISLSCGAARTLSAPEIVRLKPDATKSEVEVASGFSRTEKPEVEVASGFSRTEKPEVEVASGFSRTDPAIRLKPDATAGSPIAVAGIAHPDRFFESLRDAGWSIADTIAFPDHHRYTSADVDRIARRVQQSGASSVFTTEKDAVRFEALGPLPFPLFRVPLTLQFDPPGVLFDSVRAVLA